MDILAMIIMYGGYWLSYIVTCGAIAVPKRIVRFLKSVVI